MATIAEILRTKISKNGKSKAYVASQLGVTEKTIENYMNGKREPDTTSLVKLAQILEFSLSELSEQIVPEIAKTASSKMQGASTNEKYVALLEKTLNEKEADLVALRSAVNGINEVNGRVDKLEPIVYGLSKKAEDAETISVAVREFVIDQIAKIRNESTAKVAAEAGKYLVDEIKRRRKQDIQHG